MICRRCGSVTTTLVRAPAASRGQWPTTWVMQCRLPLASSPPAVTMPLQCAGTMTPQSPSGQTPFVPCPGPFCACWFRPCASCCRQRARLVSQTGPCPFALSLPLPLPLPLIPFRPLFLSPPVHAEQLSPAAHAHGGAFVACMQHGARLLMLRRKTPGPGGTSAGKF